MANVEGRRIPLIVGEEYLCGWPEPLSLVEFEALTRQIRNAVARVYSYPAEYVPALRVVRKHCPSLTGQEMIRIAKFVAALGAEGAKALEESYIYLESRGVNPAQIPYRYAVPAAVRVMGSKAGEAVYAEMHKNPNRSAWGNAAAAKIISEAIRDRQGEVSSPMTKRKSQSPSSSGRLAAPKEGQLPSPTYITIDVKTGRVISDAPLPDDVVSAIQSVCTLFEQEEE